MKKIGILTFCHPINYGAYLQSYSLCNRLLEEGFDAEVIDYKMTAEDNYYRGYLKLRKNILCTLYARKRYKMFQNAWKDMPASAKKIRSDDLEDVRKELYAKYDLIITGSDEIWKIDGMRGFPTPYFLPGDYGCKKIAYAVSGRTSFSILSQNDKCILENCIEGYEYIGVRDEKTYKEVKLIIGDSERLHMNCDPTFIYDFKPDRQKGSRILKERYGIDITRPCIGIMFYEDWKRKPILLNVLKQKISKDTQIIALYDLQFGIKNTPELHPLDWVHVIAALDGIVTMYFHAVCFSLITGTPFVAIETRAKDRDTSKIFDLLKRHNMIDRFWGDVSEVCKSQVFDSFLSEMEQRKRIDFSSEIKSMQVEFKRFIDIIKEKCERL